MEDKKKGGVYIQTRTAISNGKVNDDLRAVRMASPAGRPEFPLWHRIIYSRQIEGEIKRKKKKTRKDWRQTGENTRPHRRGEHKKMKRLK